MPPPGREEEEKLGQNSSDKIPSEKNFAVGIATKSYDIIFQI